ncbi:MAG: NADPH-dependent 7-cyano-7-deazaguanine reductase QueF [Victivallales bacterium]|nr:NADPH-dependent 7-cyano-7-deazaguanine reductase QueF [Victivallales bacterium]MCF7888652.1 NADPH-dependent 7-cyano-7-deazaguanine reductase QueF [Victivallales bacterium]
MLENINSKINPLGEQSEYISEYDNSLLYPISRKMARDKADVDETVFKGFDIWNCYELSWLNRKGKPECRILRFVYPHDSENIIESKSLKLYLNSFTMSSFKSDKDVLNTIRDDLEKSVKAEVDVQFFLKVNDAFRTKEINKKLLIDDYDVETAEYEPDSTLMEFEKDTPGEYEIFSNLLKTNCPVTKQPDWATLHIKYYSDIHIKECSLLKYIISYRNAEDFHELCCEKIFTDIHYLIQPEKLYVKCYYTRRGGVDINPVRSLGYKMDDDEFSIRHWRQ